MHAAERVHSHVHTLDGAAAEDGAADGAAPSARGHCADRPRKPPDASAVAEFLPVLGCTRRHVARVSEAPGAAVHARDLHEPAQAPRLRCSVVRGTRGRSSDYAKFSVCYNLMGLAPNGR